MLVKDNAWKFEFQKGNSHTKLEGGVKGLFLIIMFTITKFETQGSTLFSRPLSKVRVGFWVIKLNGVEPCVLKAYYLSINVIKYIVRYDLKQYLEMVHNITFQTFTRPGCSNDGRP